MVAVRVIVKLSIGDLVHVEIVQVRDQVRVHKCDPLHNYRKLQIVKFLQDNVEQPHDEHGQVGPLQEKYGFLLHNVRVNHYPLYQQLLWFKFLWNRSIYAESDDHKESKMHDDVTLGHFNALQWLFKPHLYWWFLFIIIFLFKRF